MAPDDDACEPAAALSEQMPLPALVRRAMPGEYVGLGGGCRRLYDVFRVDGPARKLAVLAVSAGRLAWWEVGAGGALELAPGWLRFVPRADPVPGHALTRCLVQAIDGMPGHCALAPTRSTRFAATLDRPR